MRHSTAGISASGERDEINLTPMLDVVFIMLIFFIVTASFLREAGLDVNRPDGGATPPVENQVILIRISEHSDIWMNGRHIDPRALRANIQREYAGNPEAKVVIQAHARSATRALVQAMDASRQAGIYDIAVAADQVDAGQGSNKDPR